MLKPLPIITTCTPQPYHPCVWVYNTIPRSIIVLQRRWGRGTDAILIIGQGLHWTGVCVHWDAGCCRYFHAKRNQRRGFGQCLPAKGGVAGMAAAQSTKKCGLLCHDGTQLLLLCHGNAPLPWKKTPLYYTAMQHCTTEHWALIPTQPNYKLQEWTVLYVLTTTAILLLSSWLQMGNRPKLYSPKNRPQPNGQSLVCVRRTWQYRHGTGADIKHVQCRMCNAHCTAHMARGWT